MKEMKRIFIVISLFVYIYCSIESCIEEEDLTQCQKHSIEISEMSCHLVETTEEKNCSPYVDNHPFQKWWEQYEIGCIKEHFSFDENDLDEEGKKIFDLEKEINTGTYLLPEKDTYKKGDTIKMKEFPLKNHFTNNDINIIKKGNTCSNQIGQNFKKLKIKSLNKTDCFNVDKFDELKNLLDCGFNTFNIKYNNKDYQFFNCFVIEDENADSTFKKFYKEFYSSQFVLETIHEIEQEFMEEVGQYLKINNLQKRKLQNQKDFDLTMTVEDRYGNIRVYDKNGKIIDEPKKFLHSSHYSLNIFIFLLNLLLLL